MKPKKSVFKQGLSHKSEAGPVLLPTILFRRFS